MKLTKSLLKEMVSEQVEVLSEQIDVDELVDAHDLDHSQQGVPFFLSLVSRCFKECRQTIIYETIT